MLFCEMLYLLCVMSQKFHLSSNTTTIKPDANFIHTFVVVCEQLLCITIKFCCLVIYFLFSLCVYVMSMFGSHLLKNLKKTKKNLIYEWPWCICLMDLKCVPFRIQNSSPDYNMCTYIC